MQLQELPISNIDQVVLYDKFWGTFAILKIKEGFILQIQIRNYLPDALFVYKLEKQPTLMFSFEISRDNGVIEPGEKHTFEIKYKPNYNLNAITEKHSFCLTIVKMRSTELYNLTTINKPSAQLLENHEGNQYDLTFLPRTIPQLNQLTFHDFDFIQRPKINKEQNMKVRIYPTMLLQNTYQSLQIRFNYFKERKINEKYLNNIMSQILYIKVGLNYFSQMSLQDRIQMVNKIKFQLKTSEFCFNCLDPNEKFEQHIQCGICGCFIGCCESCAQNFLKMHYHECNKFVGYKMLQNLSQKDIENCFMEYKEEQNTIPVNTRVNITNNQFFKEQWMSECQKMLEQSIQYVEKLHASDKLKGDFGPRQDHPRVVTSTKVIEEADKILQLYNYNREKEEYEIEVEIDKDVKATLDNINRCKDKQTFLKIIERCKQIYDSNFDQLKFMTNQYEKYKETYETEKEKMADLSIAMQKKSLTKYAFIQEWSPDQIHTVADPDIQVHSDFTNQFNKKLNQYIDEENYDALDEELNKIFQQLYENKNKTAELQAKSQQLDQDKINLKKEMGKTIGTYKNLTQELQQLYHQNNIYSKILDICESNIVDQKNYKKLKDEDRLDELDTLATEEQIERSRMKQGKQYPEQTNNPSQILQPEQQQYGSIRPGTATDGGQGDIENQYGTASNLGKHQLANLPQQDLIDNSYQNSVPNNSVNSIQMQNNQAYSKINTVNNSFNVDRSGMLDNNTPYQPIQRPSQIQSMNSQGYDLGFNQLDITQNNNNQSQDIVQQSGSSYKVVGVHNQPISPAIILLQNQKIAPDSSGQNINVSQLQLSQHMTMADEIRNKELGFMQEQQFQNQKSSQKIHSQQQMLNFQQQQEQQQLQQQQGWQVQQYNQYQQNYQGNEYVQLENGPTLRRPRQYTLLNNSEVTFSQVETQQVNHPEAVTHQSQQYQQYQDQTAEIQQNQQLYQQQQIIQQNQQQINQQPQNEAIRVQMETESLYNILVRLQKYQAELEGIGDDLGKDMYFKLINLQANMYNILIPMLNKLLNNAIKMYGIASEPIDLKKHTFRSVELKYRPQVNTSLPHPFQIAAQYEHFYDEIERLCYYSIAKEPWALEEYQIDLKTTPYIDEHCDPEVLYEMLQAIKEANIQL